MTMSIAGSLMTSRAFAVRIPGGSAMPLPDHACIGREDLGNPGPDGAEPDQADCDAVFHEVALFFPAGEFERLLDAANRLSRAVLVFDKTETDVLVAVLAEPDARRHRDLGLMQEQLGEFQRSHGAVCVGDAG